MTDTIDRFVAGGREFVLVGTAHVSKESISEVESIIRDEQPSVVCVEIDKGRYAAMTDERSWEKLDIIKVIKEGKSFLMLANLALASFQRRLGKDIGVKPGAEMKRAIEVAQELGISFELCDREVQTTLKRAWASCGFISKSKLLAALLSSAFTTEKLDEAGIESLKNKNELDGMMSELSDYLPSVKKTLIDERDQYLASRIWTASGQKLVAVIGAGHMGGVHRRIEELAAGTVESDVSSLDAMPPKGFWSKAAPWIIPAALVALFAVGFFRSGAEMSFNMLLRWMLLNGSLAAFGALLALAHPLAILVSFVGAPIATINPFIGVGMFSGLVQAMFRKPCVSDAAAINDDISSLKGIYKNRITRVLLVFFLSSLGGALGNFISIPWLTALVSG
jgi:pheromone shutdown-related protein TraB